MGPFPISLLLFIFSVLVTGTVIQNNVVEDEGNTEVDDHDVPVETDQYDWNKNRSKRQISNFYSRWPNAKIYYYIVARDGIFNFTVEEQRVILYSLNYISSRTCITFEESRTAVNRLRIRPSDGCGSLFGMATGEQSIVLTSGCITTGGVVHELMHVLSIDHTQSRMDRDDYIIVNEDLLDDNGRVNMGKTKNLYNVVPYEYGSTMHYSRLNYPGALEAKDAAYKDTMGLRRVTFYDMVAVNHSYDCKCSTELDCKNGGYTNPSNCSECVCPEGFGGRLCDGSPPSSVHVTAASGWKGYKVNIGYTELFSGIFTIRYLIIHAPADKTIQVRIKKFDAFPNCFASCNLFGVEMKLKGDPRILNPLFCCPQNIEGKTEDIYESKQNPLPIVLHTRSSTLGLMIHYRYIDVPLSKNNLTTNGYDDYQYYA